MTTIRKSREKEGFAESAELDLPQGAHLKCMSNTYFGPKFAKAQKDEDNPNVEETFWNPRVAARFIVIDDRSDGDADGEEFTDYFDLKLDLDRLAELGFGDFDERRLKKNPAKSNFTKEEQEMLLDPENWTIREGTKYDNYNIAAFGKEWINGSMEYRTEDMVDTEVIAKVQKRTGAKKGSMCEWNTFMSVNPPKKQGKSRIQNAQQQAAQAPKSDGEETAELSSEEDEKETEETISSG